MDKSFYDDLYLDIPLELRKKYQIVGTAEWVYDLMVKQVPVDPGACYLDPCVGRGVGIKALLKAGVREEQIVACDIVLDNISYCKSIHKNVNYVIGDLLSLSEKYDYVIGVPPWVSKLPLMINHLASLAVKKCVLIAPFFYDNKRYNLVESFVSNFYVDDFDTMVKFALSSCQHFGVPCIYEFQKTGATGFHNILVKWISANGLSAYFTFDKKKSVPNNLVMYAGQEYFLPINPTWFLPYTFNGFSVSDVHKFSIFGTLNKSEKCYGLAYDYQEKLDKAREHYQSETVKKMLACGVDFGWKHLKAV